MPKKSKYIKLSEKEKAKAFRKYCEEKELKPFQAELIKLQKHLEKSGKKMIVLFEGRDAAGKGGAIKRVMEYQNNTRTRVVALGKPTEKEAGQLYFQKYIQYFPTNGEIVLFDRSWYNRAMVEKVFGFCTQEEYEHFMKVCPKQEKIFIDDNVILLKFYFSVSKKEQSKRFEKRKTNPLKQWKLSEIDVQAQDKWNEFTKVKYKMLKRTHTNLTPWNVIRSNNKHNARLTAIKLMLNSIDYEDRSLDLDYNIDTNICIRGSREVEIMEAKGVKSGIYPN